MTYADVSRETRRQQRHWGRHAESYDNKIAKVERSMLAGTREWIGERATGRVLEVAGGSGRSLPYYRDDVSLVGIDLSREMLAIARRRATELGMMADLRAERSADTRRACLGRRGHRWLDQMVHTRP